MVVVGGSSIGWWLHHQWRWWCSTFVGCALHAVCIVNVGSGGGHIVDSGDGQWSSME